MESINSLQTILQLLYDFYKGKKSSLYELSFDSGPAYHYYMEIVRYWNKLNYIVQKILRSLGNLKKFSDFENIALIYLTYRAIWERAPFKAISKELHSVRSNFFKLNANTILRFYNKIKWFSWDVSLKSKSPVEKLSLIESIPTFLITHLLKVMDFSFLEQNLRLMNDFSLQETLTARISDPTNVKLNDNLIEQIIADFKSKRIAIYRDAQIPELFHFPFKTKKAVISSEWYKNGYLIFQDKASAGIVHVLDPNPKDFICDMCAAPGVKTSLISQYAINKARIVASEFFLDRTIAMKNILTRLNVANVMVINTDSIAFPLQEGVKFDKILLDAPCTGSGALLSNPELKQRQNSEFLTQNATLQKKLLKSAISLLKPSGILVYSTCSLYPDEGELQIRDFIDQLDPLDVPAWFSPSYKINEHIIPGTARLFPSEHHTQGFFVGKFKKK